MTATTTTCATPMIVPPPAAPRTLEQTGLSVDLLVQLVLKTLHFAGELTGSALGERLGLHYNAIQPAVNLLKSVRQIEIVGGSLLGGASFKYRITDSGRTRAALFLEQNRYVGLAPVPLAQYQAYMRAFTREAPHAATRERVRQAFSHLVVNGQILDQLGPAINAGRSLFIYGPAGNGKTVMAQAIRNLLDGEIAIPHAIEVEGHIIRLFDRINHEPIPADAPSGASIRRHRTTPAGFVAPAAAGHGRRRAHARADAAQPEPGGLLPRAAAGDRQRRRAGDRRLRTPALLAVGAAESLDRAAREPRRLSQPRDRADVRAAVRGPRGVRHEPASQRAGRRTFLRRSTEGVRGRTHADGVRPDFESCCEARDLATIRRWSRTSSTASTGPGRFRCAAAIRAISSTTRSHSAIPRRPQAAHAGAAGSCLRGVLVDDRPVAPPLL